MSTPEDTAAAIIQILSTSSQFAWDRIDPDVQLELVAGVRDILIEAVDGNTSDGHHTFNELYEYRLLYNAGLFNEWAARGVNDVHKARRHSDGEPCFGGGWFIVVAQLPTGQISNHYPDKAWDLFQIPQRERAAEWDGHGPAAAAARLRAMLTAGISS